MSEYRVELSGAAKSDIVSIYDYIRNHLMNPSAASKFIKDTDEAVSSLEVFPYRNAVRPGSDVIGSVVKRQYPYRDSFCMYYIVKEELKLVRVIKVSYSARNLD